jgi:hypothetical protein
MIVQLAVWFTVVLPVFAAEPAAEPAPDPAGMKAFVPTVPRPANRPLDVGGVWQWQPSKAVYKVKDSQAKGHEAPMTLTPPLKPGEPWKYERLGQRVESMVKADDGSVQLIALDNIEKGVIVKFTPALCVMPPVLQPNQVHETKADITVVSRENPEHQKASGTAVMSVVYDADQQVKTPAGEFACHRIRVTCDADFGWGSTRNVSTYYYAEKVGLVAENYDSQTTLLLIGSERHIRSILAQLPEPAPTPTAAR